MGHTFRVVVVGGGVSGLVASHCLHRIGIEHVVLERGSEAAPPEGASIAIYPHGARILDQIGCLEAAKQACTPMSRFINRLPNGAATVDSGFFDYVKEKYLFLLSSKIRANAD
jgi:2-polyprenyl-6-methoxyphenol hydroxylase-like FAD-dependent oxidoreductase